MSAWSADDLARIGNAQEYEVSSLRPDGSLRPFVTIWVSGTATTSTCARRTALTTLGSVERSRRARAGSGPAVWSATSRSWSPDLRLPTGSPRSITPSTTVMDRGRSGPSSRQKPSGRPSGLFRADLRSFVSLEAQSGAGLGEVGTPGTAPLLIRRQSRYGRSRSYLNA